jgi:hypothetical protein
VTTSYVLSEIDSLFAVRFGSLSTSVTRDLLDRADAATKFER